MKCPLATPSTLAAVGYLRLGIYEYNQRDARSHWDDIMNEITDVTGDVFLGMGMACARCHDHKFDPLLQKDYFKLRAFFEPLIWRDDIPYATIAQKEGIRKTKSRLGRTDGGDSREDRCPLKTLLRQEMEIDRRQVPLGHPGRVL